MSGNAKLISGIILLTVPTIQYGGYFLLKIISGQMNLSLTDFQRSMFRAGHAHSGVLVILALIAQLLVDGSTVSPAAEWFLRLGFPLAAILIGLGFFAAALGRNQITPNRLVVILYSGITLLATVVIFLGIELIRSR
jgi:hypothetical protein